MTKIKGGEQEENINWWPMIALLLAATGVGLWLGYSQYSKIKNNPVPTATPVQKSIPLTTAEDVVAAVAKLMILPSTKPSLAIIDKSVEQIKLTEPFFKDAVPGDRILVYPDRAIIYRPSRNVIVNVGPISVIKNTAEEKQTWSIEIRNGSQTKGAAKKLADTLTDDKMYQIEQATNAANADYQGNQILNFSNRDIKELADKFEANIITSLPADEATSTAEVLLILGN